MKRTLIYIIIFFIIVVVLGISFFGFDFNKKTTSSTNDLNIVTNIDGIDLNTLYIGGNIIDESIAYGNKVSKIIDITNNSKEDVSFAISISEVTLSDDYLTYTVSYSFDKSAYSEINKNINLTGEDNLAYNLVITANSSISLKIDFYGNNEIKETKFKGKLAINSNITEKDIFRKDVLYIHSIILAKIKSINDINESGYFIFSLRNLSKEILNDFSGFVLVDAIDYSDLKFYYSIYNSKYMLDNYELKNNDVLKKYIKELDNEKVSSLDFQSVCLNHTKKSCLDFNSLKLNPIGGKENFYKSSMEVIHKVKASFKGNEKLVYIYDVNKDIENDTNIRGYILINNIVDNPEYYIYLTNDIYMISGYNFTKLGEYSKGSKTIRMYSESSYNLSSESMSKVCSFSGFSECVTATGEKVT